MTIWTVLMLMSDNDDMHNDIDDEMMVCMMISDSGDDDMYGLCDDVW